MLAQPRRQRSHVGHCRHYARIMLNRPTSSHAMAYLEEYPGYPAPVQRRKGDDRRGGGGRSNTLGRRHYKHMAKI
jgi:hypothetical protein